MHNGDITLIPGLEQLRILPSGLSLRHISGHVGKELQGFDISVFGFFRGIVGLESVGEGYHFQIAEAEAALAAVCHGIAVLSIHAADGLYRRQNVIPGFKGCGINTGLVAEILVVDVSIGAEYMGKTVEYAVIGLII